MVRETGAVAHAAAQGHAPPRRERIAIQGFDRRARGFAPCARLFERRRREQDGEFLEIISGLLPGDEYVAENSFILKAEIEKSEAKDID